MNNKHTYVDYVVRVFNYVNWVLYLKSTRKRCLFLFSQVSIVYAQDINWNVYKIIEIEVLTKSDLKQQGFVHFRLWKMFEFDGKQSFFLFLSPKDE